MPEVGHVFVVHADLTKLACDYYLIPTDASLDVGRHWRGKFGSPRSDLPVAKVSDTDRVTNARTLHDGARVRWVDTGSVPDARSEPLGWLEDGVRQAFSEVDADLRDVAGGRNRRARPLVGMPVFGTGAGGYDGIRGEVLDMLLELTHGIAAGAAFDIVIVCYDRSDYAALQARPKRLELSSGALSRKQLEVADSLGERARAGSLVLFLGAGVSIPAGLPSWGELIEKLAEASPNGMVNAAELADMAPPDAASALMKSSDAEEFAELLGQQLRRDEHALGHALLASLRVDEVITTNFDDLYEQSAAITFGERRLRVLPWERAEPGLPWLLKMHGGIDRSHVVFSRKDYDTYETSWGPLRSIVQALLMTRHVLFVGYSLKDENFKRLTEEVRDLFKKEAEPSSDNSAPQVLGTIVTLQPERETTEQWSPDLDTIAASEDCAAPDGSGTADAGRKLEIFLDRIAAKAASDEHSYVLDPRYAELLVDTDRAFAEQLVKLAHDLPDSHPAWRKVKELVASYGAPGAVVLAGASHPTTTNEH